ncbi:2-amino-4-hydroxy-6-hydroxymethyldihydropteridine diphosphokinase [Alteribacillus sp. HJP-4]|uniref:2-amino-4-hydroxy-6- hydroxymethyldihydropteridine diphosphokinase n=1 Tax=Alteribacillus sp. HJP-4 TaxID=2775394 RepID=UPI0035CD0C5E
MTHSVYIALGSNIGDREYYLREALKMLEEKDLLRLSKLSSIYETEPVGVTDQAAFLNMVVEMQADMSPLPLLELIQQIEENLDRVRTRKWGPRTIDLDILLYNDENIEMSELSIPHPRMHERAFVLVPFCEIAPQTMHPLFQRTIEDITNALPDNEKEGVHIWKNRSTQEGFGLFGN